MTHYRSDYRAAARAVLAAHPRFRGFTVLRVWNGNVDASTLPVLGVLTPQERVEEPRRASATRRTLLQIALRRSGGDDVEDVLDEDSDVIEALILSALSTQIQSCMLEETSVVADPRGHSNVGTLVMSFRITSFRAPRRAP